MLKDTSKYIVYKHTMPSRGRQSDTDNSEYNNHMSNQGSALGIRRRRYFPTRYGGFCVNAVTGSRYPYGQGSFESLRLYQVIDSSGTCDNKGYVRERHDEPNKTPNFLFYDSPEQYSRHMKVDVDGKVSYQWHNDVKNMFPDNVFDKSAYLEIRNRKHNLPIQKKSSNKVVDNNSDDDWN